MERDSKQTPRAAYRRRTLFTFLPFFHPDYTVGVGFAGFPAHRTPTSGALRHPLAGLPLSTAPATLLGRKNKWITADRELGFRPHPALKVLS
jgi:hypothetical protein